MSNVLYVYKLLLSTNFPKGNEVNYKAAASILCRSPLQPTGMGCMLVGAICLTRSAGTFWEHERGRKLCIEVDLQRKTECYDKCRMRKCKEGNCRRHLSQGHLKELYQDASQGVEWAQFCALRQLTTSPVKDALWLTAVEQRDLATLSGTCAMAEVSQPCLQLSSLLLKFWSPG